MARIIVEGLNAVGKTTLCNNLKSFLKKHKQNTVVKHGMHVSFSVLRENAYNSWNPFSSMLYYLASNVETMDEKEYFDHIIYDRSFLSTLTMFMSRDANWNTGVDFLNLLIENNYLQKDDIIILLKASEKTRKKRILSKTDTLAREADIKEFGYEKNKDDAYDFLIKNLKDYNNLFVLKNDFLTERETLIAVLSFLKMKGAIEESAFTGF